MMAFDVVPAIVKVAVVFGIVVFSIRKKLSLGNAFFLGSLLLGLFFGMSMPSILKTAGGAIFYPKTVALALIVSLILVLSDSMESTGQMRRLLSSFRGLVRSIRVNMVVFPALIGLLPMPGGAVFSAPMVKEIGAWVRLGGEKMSFINYWYRHIWEYWWPLYPAVLLVTALADLNLWIYVAIMWPMTLASVAFGWFSLMGLGISGEKESDHRMHSFKSFAVELTPILIVVVFGLSLGILLSLVYPGLSVAKEAGLVVALVVAIGWVWVTNDLDWVRIRRILTDRHLIDMVYMVASILVFKGMLEGSHAVKSISADLHSAHLPLLLIVTVLPLIVGLVAGISIAFVGSTFPIIIPLVYSFGEGIHLYAYMMLAVVSGFMGVLLSPLHLCLLLTNQYFETTIREAYRYLWLPCLSVFIFSLLYFSILKRIGQWAF
ncbi:MAG: DUF401 family protein [Deltaproteobacteria bacterium]|nr:DUF401 family protein [Deltaproteobacteria bacterium]